jgi:hypothetical protein
MLLSQSVYRLRVEPLEDRLAPSVDVSDKSNLVYWHPLSFPVGIADFPMKSGGPEFSWVSELETKSLTGYCVLTPVAFLDAPFEKQPNSPLRYIDFTAVVSPSLSQPLQPGSTIRLVVSLISLNDQLVLPSDFDGGNEAPGVLRSERTGENPARARTTLQTGERRSTIAASLPHSLDAMTEWPEPSETELDPPEENLTKTLEVGPIAEVMHKHPGSWFAWNKANGAVIAIADSSIELTKQVTNPDDPNLVIEVAPGVHPAVAARPFKLLKGESPNIIDDVALLWGRTADQWLDSPNRWFSARTPRELVGTPDEKYLRYLLRAVRNGTPG